MPVFLSAASSQLSWLLAVMTSLSLVVATTASVKTMPLIPHHVQKQRRLKQLQEESGLRQDPRMFDRDTQFRRRDEALQVGALYHGYGTHYADVWVGTPPQRQTVIVDTGSSLTAFPCTGCADCGAPTYHIDDYFDFSASKTFVKTPCGQCQRGSCSNFAGADQCGISMSYQEGSSWFAFEAKDVTYVGGPHMYALTADQGTEDIDPKYAKHFAFDMTFGCQYRLTGLFKTQLADGIMGMENAETSFWKQLYAAGKMGTEAKFSLCFSRPLQTAKNGTEAGAMTFGGVEKRLHMTDMVYTSNGGGRSGFFGVTIRRMYMRGGVAGGSAKASDPKAKLITLNIGEGELNSGGVIVDSGTTDTYFVRSISSAFRSAFKTLSGTDYSHNSVSLTKEQLAAYPTILIQLYGDEALNKALNSDPKQVVGLAADIDPQNPYDVILAIPPSHYMEEDSGGKYTARFYDTEMSGSVLGANAMMGHDVMFDADNLVIGWAESSCDYHELLTESGYPDVLLGESEAAAVTPADTTNENTAGEGTTEPLTTPPAAGDDTLPNGSDSPPDSKKDHPNDGSHDEQSPVEDLKKAVVGLADACDTLACRGGVSIGVLLVIILACFCCKCLSGSKMRPKHGYARAEVELADTTFRDAESYVDEPDDAEFGEFGTDKKDIID